MKELGIGQAGLLPGSSLNFFLSEPLLLEGGLDKEGVEVLK